MMTHHPFRSAQAKAEYLGAYEMRAQAWPVAWEPRMVSSFYGQTFVRVSGSTDAQPLVLLPGMGSNSLMWMPNVEAWAECYRTFAVDNIYDYGRSVYTRTLKGPNDFVNWLDELFGALELGAKINLVGMSYGAWLTSQYALHLPSRLEKIVLLAPAATVLPVRLEFSVRLFLCLLPHRYFIKCMMYWQAKDLIQKDEAGRLIIEDAVDHSFLASRCFKPKRMVAPTVLTDQELRSINVPTLFLVGENEKIYSAQEAVQRLNRVAPRIRTEVIPDAGHDLAVVQAELVNSKVLEFLKQPCRSKLATGRYPSWQSPA
jgi:pimeloyl-ACP methyl ester carboxylesterase